MRLKLAKNQAEARQHPETELLLFENYSLSSFMLLSTIKNVQKQVCVYRFICMYLFIWLFMRKMRPNIKNRSHRYSIYRTRPRYVHKYTQFEMCLSMMILICIKQHLSKIWISIHQKVKQRWRWSEKALPI